MNDWLGPEWSAADKRQDHSQADHHGISWPDAPHSVQDPVDQIDPAGRQAKFLPWGVHQKEAADVEKCVHAEGEVSDGRKPERIINRLDPHQVAIVVIQDEVSVVICVPNDDPADGQEA